MEPTAIVITKSKLVIFENDRNPLMRTSSTTQDMASAVRITPRSTTSNMGSFTNMTAASSARRNVCATLAAETPMIGPCY